MAQLAVASLSGSIAPLPCREFVSKGQLIRCLDALFGESFASFRCPFDVSLASARLMHFGLAQFLISSWSAGLFPFSSLIPVSIFTGVVEFMLRQD